jgi:hypothetical protein
VNLAPPLRAATPADAPALAELINFAGEGLPLFLWGRMAEPGETAWDVGRRRARRDEGGFSWRNATVAEPEGGAVAACLIGYPLPEAPEPIDPARTPPMSVPLEELERLAPGTWYVNVLAAYPRWRGRGLARPCSAWRTASPPRPAAAGQASSSPTPTRAPAASTGAAATASARAVPWPRTAGTGREPRVSCWSGSRLACMFRPSGGSREEAAAHE